MAKVKDKIMNTIHTVYGAREVVENYRDYEGSYSSKITELLIYSYGNWNWVNAEYYEPIEE